jgi:hypothetical protein
MARPPAPRPRSSFPPPAEPRPRLASPSRITSFSRPATPSRRVGGLSPVLGATVAALLATPLLAGCGGSAKAATPAGPTLAPALQGDPTAVVDGAAGRTATATAVSVRLTVPVWRENKLDSVDGEGTADFAAGTLKLTVPDAERAEERQFGRTVYVLLPEAAGPSLGGKQWVKVDLDTAQGASPDPFNLFAYDPHQLVTSLTAVSGAKLVGQEQVDGGNAGHFTGTLDPAALAGAGVEPAFAKQFRTATKGAPVPVDVWVADDGTVRRVSLPLLPPGAPATAATTGAKPTTTVDLSDFGTADVSFTEPPANTVADPAALAALSGNGD